MTLFVGSRRSRLDAHCASDSIQNPAPVLKQIGSVCVIHPHCAHRPDLAHLIHFRIDAEQSFVHENRPATIPVTCTSSGGFVRSTGSRPEHQLLTARGEVYCCRDQEVPRDHALRFFVTAALSLPHDMHHLVWGDRLNRNRNRIVNRNGGLQFEKRYICRAVWENCLDTHSFFGINKDCDLVSSLASNNMFSCQHIPRADDGPTAKTSASDSGVELVVLPVHSEARIHDSGRWALASASQCGLHAFGPCTVHHNHANSQKRRQQQHHCLFLGRMSHYGRMPKKSQA